MIDAQRFALRCEGFVLVTVLWTVAAIMVLAGIFHGYVAGQVALAQGVKERAEHKLDMRATEHTVHHLLATRRATLAGLTTSLAEQSGFVDSEGNIILQPRGGELLLDGAPYRGVGDVVFSLQDHSGLFSLNSPATPRLVREYFRDSLDDQTTRELGATLADYIDENTFRRINGAEAREYIDRGLAPPTNWYLRSELEATRVLGWDSLLSNPQLGFSPDMFSIAHIALLNPNTAPRELLAASLYISREDADQLIAARREYPFQSLEGVAAALGGLNEWEELYFRFFTSNRIRVQLWCDGCNLRTIQSLEFTPNGLYGPWLMDYSYRTTLGSKYKADSAGAAGGLFARSPSAGW